MNFSLAVSCLLLFLLGCVESVPKEQAQELQSIPLDATEGEASLTRNFYFIFDGSGSMSERCAGQQKIVGAKVAVERFLEKVPADANLGLLVFDNHGTREVVSLGSNNRVQFLQAIMEVDNGGGTPLATSIVIGSDRLVEQYKKQLGYGDFRLIVVTDGQASGIPDAANYAASYGIPIYAIGLCIEGDHPLHSFAISYREAGNYEDLERALEETVAETEVYDPTVFE
jgi:hypothetical protein